MRSQSPERHEVVARPDPTCTLRCTRTPRAGARWRCRRRGSASQALVQRSNHCEMLPMLTTAAHQRWIVKQVHEHECPVRRDTSKPVECVATRLFLDRDQAIVAYGALVDWEPAIVLLSLIVWGLVTVVGSVESDKSRHRLAEQSAAQSRRREARARTEGLRRSPIGGYSPGWWGQMLREHDYRCFYCRRKIPKTERIHKEHEVPLSRGGPHHVDNIKPSCRLCNLRKGTKTGAEYRSIMQACGGMIPPAAQRQVPAAGRPTARSEVVRAMHLLKQQSAQDSWSVGEIVEAVREVGSTRPLASLRATISTMGTEGALLRVARGRYRIR